MSSAFTNARVRCKNRIECAKGRGGRRRGLSISGFAYSLAFGRNSAFAYLLHAIPRALDELKRPALTVEPDKRKGERYSQNGCAAQDLNVKLDKLDLPAEMYLLIIVERC